MGEVAALAGKREPGSFAAGVVTVRALRAVLPRLAAAPCTTPELLALAPELVCGLGFSRALVSRVADSAWHPEVVHIVGDPDRAAEVEVLARAASLPLTPGLPETTLVLTRQAIIVRDAQQRRCCGPAGLLAVTKAAPTSRRRSGAATRSWASCTPTATAPVATPTSSTGTCSPSSPTHCNSPWLAPRSPSTCSPPSRR